MIFFMVRFMGKNISFLFLASIMLSINSNAMEDTSPTPPAFNQIRQRYNLSITDSYGIPEKIQTRVAESHQPEQVQFTLNPDSATFYEELRETVLTPAALYELLPLDQQAEFFSEIRKEGSQIDLLSSDTEFKNSALRRQANLTYAKFFLTSLNNAISVIPASLFQYCPATLIADQQFSSDDDHSSLAYKYERLGLVIKDTDEGITSRNQHFLMSESFGKAGEHFLAAAKESNDVFSTVDLLISSGICYEWSAVRCLDFKQANEKLKLAQGSFREGYKALPQAYKEYREIITERKRTQAEAAEIKKQLDSYVARIVSWSKEFDPPFYAKLTRTYKV